MRNTQTYAYKDGSTIEVAKDSEFELVAKLLAGVPIPNEGGEE